MEFFDQDIDYWSHEACVVRDGFQRSQSRDKVGAPRWYSKLKTNNDVVKKRTAFLLSGGDWRSWSRPRGGAEFTPSGAKACNLRSALHQTKKTEHSHLQTATSSKTRKGCPALCLSALSAPCLCLVSSLWILLLSHAPHQTTEHVQRASVAQCHSKITVFLVRPWKQVPQELSLVIALPFFLAIPRKLIL